MSSTNVSLDTASARGSVTVTPSNTVVIDPPSRAVYVGGAGNLAVRMAGDQSTPTYVGVLAGVIYSLCVDQVLSTGTTATNIIALR